MPMCYRVRGGVKRESLTKGGGVEEEHKCYENGVGQRFKLI